MKQRMKNEINERLSNADWDSRISFRVVTEVKKRKLEFQNKFLGGAAAILFLVFSIISYATDGYDEVFLSSDWHSDSERLYEATNSMLSIEPEMEREFEIFIEEASLEP